VEPNLPTRVQGWVWSAAYVSFAALCGTTAWRTSAHAAAPQAAIQEGAPAREGNPAWTLRLLWLGLSASASVLLLAVTNHLTQDVAAIPFLWILPLSVYLLSFIVCFESPRFYWRAVFLPLMGVALAFMAYRLWPYRTNFNPPWLSFLTHMPIRWIVVSFAVGLFACCMVCHGELARLKPHPRYLTGFYVTVSLGGAVGGLFVGLVAPNLFRAYYEFPIGLGLCAAVAFLVLARGLWRLAGLGPRCGAAALAVVLCGYLACLGVVMWEMVDGYRVVARNFYGLLRVEDEGNPKMDEDASRKLVHGTINHGEQFLREPYRRLPVTYFCPQSGIGLAMQAQEGPPRRIGILGLGCGTLAAYGRPGDTLRIYEINPLVLDIARREFTYLRDTPARVEVALGDGRLVLESEPGQQFDLLVMDAFSGDSVPVHLITREAFRTYFRHLKPDGILAVNITNTYLDLRPVVERAAAAFGKVALVYDFTPDGNDFLCFGCSWTLIMDRATAAAHPGLRDAGKVLRQERPFRTWTDDFSNMFGILR
jgi:SAM-dependent methyltransferase